MEQEQFLRFFFMSVGVVAVLLVFISVRIHIEKDGIKLDDLQRDFRYHQHCKKCGEIITSDTLYNDYAGYCRTCLREQGLYHIQVCGKKKEAK